MGYTTKFSGVFKLEKPLHQDQIDRLAKLNDDAGDEGPGGYCQWVPTADHMGIEWDGNEKFYDYVPWLEFIIKEILIPQDHILQGSVIWQGEEVGDVGVLIVTSNKVSVSKGFKRLAKAIEEEKAQAWDDGAEFILCHEELGHVEFNGPDRFYAANPYRKKVG